MELVIRILALAGYDTRVVSCRHDIRRYEADRFWRPGPLADIVGLYLTSPPLLPGIPPERAIRAKWVTFQIRGADQGWADFGGHGTYHNSHTWYETSILRPVADYWESATSYNSIAPPETLISEPKQRVEDFRDELRAHGWDLVERDGELTWKVHNNITARSKFEYYRVDWVAGIQTEVEDPRAMGGGAGFLDALEAGDRIAFWARAEQQAWVNIIAEATIEVGYDVV